MNVDRLIYLVFALVVLGFFMWFVVQLVEGGV